MLIHIGENTYSATDGIREASLNDLYYIKLKTRDEEHPTGVSLITLKAYLAEFQKVTTGAELVDNLDALMGLRCLVFIARRHAGEKVTLEEANDFQLSQLSFEREESDAELLEEAKRPFRLGRRRSRRVAAARTAR